MTPWLQILRALQWQESVVFFFFLPLWWVLNLCCVNSDSLPGVGNCVPESGSRAEPGVFGELECSPWKWSRGWEASRARIAGHDELG